MKLNTIKKWTVALSGVGLLAIAGQSSAGDITGAGATFPYPLYAKWATEYKKQTGVGVNYQSIGSGGGIKQIQAKTVDFGASDKPLSQEELTKASLIQFPAVIGGVVPVINAEGFGAGQIKLTGSVLTDIYLGKIKKWNASEIAKINTGLALPDKDITVVYRADGSGTSFIFTNYLSKVSAEWKSQVGEGTAVKWPVGTGGKGNEGVANYVKTIPWSIGYVEYAYAKQNKLSFVQIQNRDGKFVSPDDETFKSSAAKADWNKSPAMDVILTDQAGANSWPISGASFILMQKVQEKPDAGKEVVKFFTWSFANGDKMAADLDYVALPIELTKLIENRLKAELKTTDGKALLP